MRRLTYLALIFATFCAVISPASATISILAIVNGEPVTSYELEQRIALLTDATNIEVNDSNRQRIRDDALQMLIDETLKDQSALRANPNVRSVALAKANEFIEATFATETKTGAKVLRDRGIDPATVQSKYFTDLVWADFLRSTYRDKFAVIAEKIDAELIRLEKNASQPQIKLSEIVLTPSPNRSIEQTLALANEMVVAVRKGANFNAIAQQYSVAGSAKQGGGVSAGLSSPDFPNCSARLSYQLQMEPYQTPFHWMVRSIFSGVRQNGKKVSLMNRKHGFHWCEPFFHYQQMQQMLIA
ncbi:peptidylprolyl isomerase [bacterium]|nr:peptidylprolyl isomerase [bacterium]